MEIIEIKRSETIHGIMQVQGKKLKSSKTLHLRRETMYKFNRDYQFKFTDFNMPAGLKLNKENCWIRQAELIQWYDIEDSYAELKEELPYVQ